MHNRPNISINMSRYGLIFLYESIDVRNLRSNRYAIGCSKNSIIREVQMFKKRASNKLLKCVKYDKRYIHTLRNQIANHLETRVLRMSKVLFEGNLDDIKEIFDNVVEEYIPPGGRRIQPIEIDIDGDVDSESDVDNNSDSDVDSESDSDSGSDLKDFIASDDSDVDSDSDVEYIPSRSVRRVNDVNDDCKIISVRRSPRISESILDSDDEDDEDAAPPILKKSYRAKREHSEISNVNQPSALRPRRKLRRVLD